MCCVCFISLTVRGISSYSNKYQINQSFLFDIPGQTIFSSPLPLFPLYPTMYISHCPLFTSLATGGYVFGSVGLFVCLSVCVCGQHYLKRYEWFGMKVYAGFLGSKMKNSLNFGGDLPVGLLR